MTALLLQQLFNVFPKVTAMVEVNSLEQLNRLISEQFDLPMRPYSTDLKAALEIVLWHFQTSKSPHFEVFYAEESGDEPFLATFLEDAWESGTTAPIAICKAALFFLKKLRPILKLDSQTKTPNDFFRS